MTDNEMPWEPPVAGTEVEHLVAALERQRTTFRWKADGLDVDGLRAQVGASNLTIGGLLKHLALVEDDIFARRVFGEQLGQPWSSEHDGSEDWDFLSAAQDTPEQLYAYWDDAVRRSRARLAAALADGGLDRPCRTWPDGRTPTLRRHVFDLVEEYGRHTGHADLLREAIDGRVGEDPPPGWHPISGQPLW
jgi:hypothetical protein